MERIYGAGTFFGRILDFFIELVQPSEEEEIWLEIRVDEEALNESAEPEIEGEGQMKLEVV